MLSALLGVVVVAVWTLSSEMRTTVRWILYSGHYKKQLLAVSPPSDGYLRHIEWDSWGFAGAGNTVVYLVQDPSRHLGKAATGSNRVRPGLPCEVSEIRELEPGYYTVLFYTMTTWNDCVYLSQTPVR
jgi:hypothetical protein